MAASDAKPSVMDDPSSQAVARTYVVAYLEAAHQEWRAAAEELESFVNDFLGASVQFDELLRLPSLSNDEKTRLIDRCVAPRCSQRLTNFLKLLNERGRLELLQQMGQAVRAEIDARDGKISVVVQSAQPLSGANQQLVSARLAEQLGKQPVLQLEVDPELMGGLVIRVGDTVYDGSLRSRIRQLRGKLRERYLHEIQRGRDRFRSSEGN